MKKTLGKILRKLGWIKPKPQPQVTHEDEVIFKIQENVIFQVYWKSFQVGTGPAVILKAFGQEILKFDCFGKEKGHYHIAPNYEFRIYFVEETVSEQIQRTIKELEINGLRYLKMQQDPRIKALDFSTSSYTEVLKLVESTLIQYHENLLLIKPDSY
jgi:hypothetical protein